MPRKKSNPPSMSLGQEKKPKVGTEREDVDTHDLDQPIAEESEAEAEEPERDQPEAEPKVEVEVQEDIGLCPYCEELRTKGYSKLMSQVGGSPPREHRTINDVRLCGAVHPGSNKVCTRHRGHDGPHVHCVHDFEEDGPVIYNNSNFVIKSHALVCERDQDDGCHAIEVWNT